MSASPAPAPRLPGPADPTPRWTPVRLALPDGSRIVARDDAYSDRIRCDAPRAEDGLALGRALIDLAAERGRGRIVVLAGTHLSPGLFAAGLRREATIPGFFRGRVDCEIFGFWLSPSRRESADPEAVAQVDALLREPPGPSRHPRVPTERATERDAEAIAALIAATFEHYPTPSGVPEYIARSIASGTPFRLVRDGGEVVACASADLVRDAGTAELTDCATRPDHRGRGLMQSILADLMDDLRAMDFPTAFTLARARIAGVNLAFQRLGFAFRGRMVRSCRIGGGIEDMNVWSARLDGAGATPSGAA